jgi:hypothetical protein
VDPIHMICLTVTNPLPVFPTLDFWFPEKEASI